LEHPLGENNALTLPEACWRFFGSSFADLFAWAIVDELRVMWNARGACDLSKLAFELSRLMGEPMRAAASIS
jgi:hypothetical protein